MTLKARLTCGGMLLYCAERRLMLLDLQDIPSVLTGIDVLMRDNFSILDGAKVGLITNHTGLSREGHATVDILHRAENVDLRALFGPEHGIRGEVDDLVPDSTDTVTGLPVFSLYSGERRAPLAEHLTGLDTLVYDIQDIGCRFYTYLSTMGHCLTAAARAGMRMIVLDRPNPVGGVAFEGPLADDTRLSFTAFHPIPVRHGMTLGEMALLLNAERGINANLTVVKCEGWQRADWWDATGLTWVNPSPNMRSVTQAGLYPGIGLLEFTNVSVGRGTDTPFEVVGAPFINGRALAYVMNAKGLPGIRFVPYSFTPKASKCAGEVCGGVQMIVTDRVKLQPVRTGIEIALALRTLYLEEWQASKYMVLLANREIMDAVLAGDEYAAIAKRWAMDLKQFGQRRAPFLLY